MLNWDAFQKARKKSEPYPFAVIQELLLRSVVERLTAELPRDRNFISMRNEGSDKTYRVTNNILLPLETGRPVPGLPGDWKALARTLSSPRYKRLLSDLLATDLTGGGQEITLKHYYRGDFISPHTDKPQVTATHLLFLNETWRDEWGGQFAIMNDAETIAYRFDPLRSHSLAFRRSERSWHRVIPIKTDDPQRIAIQVVFWNTRTRDIAAGRIDKRGECRHV